MTSLRFPLELGKNGSFALDHSNTDKDRSKVLSTLGTALGERVMRPDFGTDVIQAHYLSGGAVQDTIINAIKDAFDRHLPSLKLYDVKITYDPHYDGSVISVDVVWGYYDDSGSPSTVSDRVNVSNLIPKIESI